MNGSVILAISRSGIYPRKNANLWAHKHLHVNFYSSSTYNHPKLETTKMWYIHIIEDYSKRTSHLKHTTWMNLKSIMLSEKKLDSKDYI